MTTNPEIQLLVTDLDNTLYDWVSFFSTAFYAMVDAAAPILDVPQERLLDELQQVHRKYHNSEQPFALLEVPCVAERFAGLTPRQLAEKLDPAFYAFNASRKSTLRTYPGVLETLRTIRASGCTVVAHTEATVENAQFRLASLDLAPLIERLYAVAPAGPDHPRPESKRAFPARVTQVRHLSQDERKPDPRVLFDICRDCNVEPSRTLYVGDSIARDIGMAKSAGVWAAWARYGTEMQPGAWERLVRVSHWTKEDVRRAADAKARFGDAVPDVTLSKFDDLISHFMFVRASSAAG